MDKDYRNTNYCKKLENVEDKKQKLEADIRNEYPRTKNMYNKVHERGSKYYRKFAKIYNEKCAYCGISLGLLPVECFEVDHFINEASYPPTQEGRTDAGRLGNLVWSCISCNRGKRGITFRSPYHEELNTDNGHIARVFERDNGCYIQIRPEYKEDTFIKKFYDALHLGYERRRIDYLLLEMQGMKNMEKDVIRRAVLGNAIAELLYKRNRMGMCSSVYSKSK